MNLKLKKSIKIFSITITSLIVLIIAALAFVANYILTAEKITPIINKVANDNLNAKLEFGSVDITPFKYFPFFGVTLKNGYIMSALAPKDESVDSLRNPEDRLIEFEKISIWVNPWDYITKNDITIAQIDIVKSNIYAYVSPEGKYSWDIINDSDSTVVDSTSGDIVIGEVKLRKITIVDAKLVFDNRNTQLYTRTDKFNLELIGDIGNTSAPLSVKMDVDNALLWREGALLFKRYDFLLESMIATNPIDSSITLSDAHLKLNDITLEVNGYLAKDTVNIDAGFNSSDISDLFKMIPESVVKQNSRFTSSGAINLQININGHYKNGKMPVAKGKLLMKDLSAKYEGVKFGIDSINGDIDFVVDMQSNSRSSITVNDLRIASSKTHIDINSKITNILRDPKIALNGYIDLDLDEMSEILPLEDSVHFGGKLKFEGSVAVDSKTIVSGNYAQIPANAKVSIDKVIVSIPKDSILLNIKKIYADVSNTKAGLLKLSVEADVTDIAVKDQIHACIDTSKVVIEGVKSSDSTSYLKGDIVCKGMHGSLAQDSIEGNIASFDMSFMYSRHLKKIFLKSNALFARYLDDSVNLSRAVIDLTSRDSVINGKVGFAGMTAVLKDVALPLKMRGTMMRFVDSDIYLDRARFAVGKSDITLTGVVKNLFGSLLGKGNLTIDTKLASTYLDINELSTIYNPSIPADSIAVVQDTTTHVFVVPKGVVFDFNMNIDRAVYDQLNMENIRGSMSVNKGRITLSGVALNAVNSELKTALEYTADSKKGADSRFVMVADKIDVASVIELLPFVDTLMPMIKSLSGELSLSITANAHFDSTMNIDINTLSGAVKIGGNDIELMDGEVFSEIAKMLYFKKKASNKVEHISAQIVLDSGKVEVFPFMLDINRYRLAVGGEHFMNNTFNYHISILKSPIPFKMGVNVSGSIDDMHIKFGKSKYKRIDEPKEVGKVNEEYLRRWNALSKGLRWE